ncbi:alpha/beta hydrolase [Photobacterium sp. BZF1]|uniref:alpha/beta fold hydrolase n=1 Tax=Photobacterium sp. BZF1 TaxID=1904457 RepID=UPI001653640D|nr:alpha/beta hydrolase [Photobacterium sp. BZF1]
MKHKSIRSDNGVVHYWTEGRAAPCILFSHGATMDHQLFEWQVEYFSSQYKVIVWDSPAHGQSRPYSDCSLENAASELVRILDQEQVQSAHLVGQSMGGYISLITARSFPERVSSFTAVGSSPLQASYYSTFDYWMLSIAPPLLKLYPHSSLIKTISENVAISAAAMDYALKTLKTYSKDEIAKIMKAVYRGVKAYGECDPLPIPVLITYGANEKTGKVEAYSQEWAERENRPLKVISNAAHNANMDNPDEFNSVLESFLSELEKKA